MRMVRPNLRRSTDEPDSMWAVSYGWWLLGTYAHACNGSIVEKTFIGPGSIRRAVRYCERRHFQYVDRLHHPTAPPELDATTAECLPAEKETR